MKEDATVLVVDDEEMLRSLLQKIDRGGIDILITDVKMPEVSGFDLLKIVKGKYPGIGAIVMTAYGDAYTVRDALLMGADEYITKPFKSFEIVMVVERAHWRILSSRTRDTKGAPAP